MSGTSLRRRILDRAVRPYALAVSLATAVVSTAALTGVTVGALLDKWPGQVIGMIGWAAVGLLWAGWWRRSETLMVRGLLWTSGVWSGVWVVLMIDQGPLSVSGWLAFCWALASGGAWLLEAEDRGET